MWGSVSWSTPPARRRHSCAPKTRSASRIKSKPPPRALAFSSVKSKKKRGWPSVGVDVRKLNVARPNGPRREVSDGPGLKKLRSLGSRVEPLSDQQVQKNESR